VKANSLITSIQSRNDILEVRVLMWYTRGSSGPSTQSTANTCPVLQMLDNLNIL
jgi:hypothetical protein